MEPAVEAQFTAERRAHLARAFGADPDQLEKLGDFENYVFGFERDGERLVLRMTHPSHRSARQMEAELDWVEHLAANGLRVARPVQSRNGRWTESVGEGDGMFHACAFHRMPGDLPGPEDWKPGIFRKWGAYVGQMHRLSESYVPTAGLEPRLRWDQDPYWVNGREFIPADHTGVLEQWDALAERMRALPEAPGAFGLCHTDLHPGNFHLHEGEIYGFDTDDCVRHWYLEDLSSLLYYGRRVGDYEPERYAREAWPEIWEGYSREYTLDPAWLEHLELFMQWRRLTLYALVYLKLSPDHPEFATYVDKVKPLIEREEPIFSADLRELAGVSRA
mgnify:CR=1 FL=1